jgi:hypothetical protein
MSFSFSRARSLLVRREKRGVAGEEEEEEEEEEAEDGKAEGGVDMLLVRLQAFLGGDLSSSLWSDEMSASWPFPRRSEPNKTDRVTLLSDFSACA